MENVITDIHCPVCGGPASFDIPRQIYVCGYCGNSVGVDEALQQKKGFRDMHRDKIKDQKDDFKLIQTVCSGCGATIIIEENEALANCAFCGRSLVRTEYLHAEELPECVIPFRITEKEAKELLSEWCKDNRHRKEAKKLKSLTPDLKGFYLPYELVRGPVHIGVSRMDRGSSYRCEGFINDEFVNSSEQLDNLLLDGMEPFDFADLKEFDLAFIAGHKVKISDVSEDEICSRIKKETEEAYTPALGKVMETRALNVDADIDSAVRLPALLPVYYIADDELVAAVNGQTGKVSVRAIKESHYYFLPWWAKSILSTILIGGLLYLALRLFGSDASSSFLITGLTAIIYFIVTLCLYSDTAHNDFSVVSGHKIFTSGEKTFTRDHGNLVLDDRLLERKVEDPVFFENIDNIGKPVELKFTTVRRIVRMVLLCLTALFLPVILALLINGFDFNRLELGGSAVWFCIAVPTVPIYLLKFGIEELYDRPLIYVTDEKGRKKRYRKRKKIAIKWENVKDVLRVVFIPPASLAFWFAIACFITMVYLTAFGFD